MKDTGKKSEATILRQKPEELLKKIPQNTGSELSDSENLQFIHELEVQKKIE